MISRIRIDAFGATAGNVEHELFVAYAHMNDALKLDAMPGEQVIERDLPEPHGTRHAFKGRLIVHPNVAEDAPQGDVVTAKPLSGSTFTWTAERGLEPQP